MTLDTQENKRGNLDPNTSTKPPPNPAGGAMFQTLDEFRVRSERGLQLKQRAINFAAALLLCAAIYVLLYVAVHFAE